MAKKKKEKKKKKKREKAEAAMAAALLPASTSSSPSPSLPAPLPAPARIGAPAWAFLAILCTIAFAGIWLATHNGLLAWIMALALLAGLLFAAGYTIKGFYLGCLMDNRNRYSLSRLQFLCWMLLVLSGFSAAVFINLHAGIAEPLAVRIPKELWVLMGIATTSLVGSPLLLNSKAQAGQGAGRTDPRDARWGDLFKAETKANEACLDVSRIQMFCFTVVLALAYGGAIVNLFLPFTSGASVETGIDSLPPIHGGMVALLGISHSAYLASKALPAG